MTCLNPRHIVNKYIEHAHDDPRSDDQRIVLNESKKTHVRDIVVFNVNDLLERYLFYVADASKQVNNTQQPTFILVFGHGAEDIPLSSAAPENFALAQNSMRR